MTRKSKRDIERTVEDLREERDTGDDSGITFYCRDEPVESPDVASRPELLVPAEAREGYIVATPKVTPATSTETTLFISARVRDTWPDEAAEADDETIHVTDLWDAMTDADLREEYRLRRENGDPIPPLLQD